MHTRLTRVLVLCSFLLPFTTSAGPLLPPVGPVVSTGKTLTEVQPRTPINAANTPGDADSLFKITQPGSYYLTGNITGVLGRHGIEIAASGVTIDLNGFDLAGIPGMGGFDGITVSALNFSNITIQNGSIRGWGGDGIDLLSFDARGARIQGIVSTSNSGQGFRIGAGSAVSFCVAHNNSSTGIQIGTGSILTNSSSHANLGTGIGASSGSTIADCSSSFNAAGVTIGTGASISNCTVFQNTGVGISAVANCSIIDCNVRASTLDGILATSGCLIRGNHCSGNGNGGDGANIHVTGNDNRIEANNCLTADRGIDVDIAGNLIIRNTCSGNNNNWDIATGNILGPIVVASTNSSAVLGLGPAPSTLNSTDPNANFSY